MSQSYTFRNKPAMLLVRSAQAETLELFGIKKPRGYLVCEQPSNRRPWVEPNDAYQAWSLRKQSKERLGWWRDHESSVGRGWRGARHRTRCLVQRRATADGETVRQGEVREIVGRRLLELDSQVGGSAGRGSTWRTATGWTQRRCRCER